MSSAASTDSRSFEDVRTLNEVVHSLYVEHAPRLRVMLSSRVPRDQLDDVCQEVWQRVIASYASRFDGTSFRAWLFTIADNYLMSMWRKRKVSLLDSPELVPANSGSTEPIAALIDLERRKILASCISELGHPRRAVMEGRLGGAEYHELASALNLTHKQAFKHYFIAKQLVATCCRTKYRGRQA